MPLSLVDPEQTDAAEREYVWTLNFGPQHPATHTTLRLILMLDGEKFIDSIPHICTAALKSSANIWTSISMSRLSTG